MDISEMRQMTDKKLRQEMAKAKRALAVKKFHVHTGQNQDVAQIKKQRQQIAQMNTILKEKQA